VTSDDDNELTIDELGRLVGMTVRNIRAHQSRGLLAPPNVRGRTGYYGPEHIARLKLIQELQADGFNLDLIRRLLDSAGSSAAARGVGTMPRPLRVVSGSPSAARRRASELLTAEGVTFRRFAARATLPSLSTVCSTNNRFKSMSDKLIVGDVLAHES